MGSRGAEFDEQATADNTPEDVAVLYSWAQLQGAKYRDYSASRREYRAQARYRAAKALLERELKAQAEAESAASRAERAVLAAGMPPDEPDSQGVLQLSAEAAARKASAERVEAARRAEAVAHAAVLALQEEREIAEAHASARRQALLYAEAEARRRQLAGPQPRERMSDMLPARESGENKLSANEGSDPAANQPHLASPRKSDADLLRDAVPEQVAWAGLQRSFAEIEGAEFAFEQTSPAWLYASQTPPQTRGLPLITPPSQVESPGADRFSMGTLQDSRERVAARWLALKSVFEDAGPELPATQPARTGEPGLPVFAVFSMAGGVGKTSLLAALGRALSSQGEKVVLTDTAHHGPLPYYFGAGDLRPGMVRSLAQSAENASPISLVSYDAGTLESERERDLLFEVMLRNGDGNHRLMFDMGYGSNWLLRRMADLHPTILVPVAPDMNSVISLQPVERMFRGIMDAGGRPLLPFYVLNQFDASLPLHLDVREVFRRQLGDRLVRIAIRHSRAVGEALAAGMTVLDYAAAAPVVQDYLDVATWLKSVSPPATAELRSARWGEQ